MKMKMKIKIKTRPEKVSNSDHCDDQKRNANPTSIIISNRPGDGE